MIYIIGGYKAETDEELYQALQLLLTDENEPPENPAVIEVGSIPSIRDFPDQLAEPQKRAYEELQRLLDVTGLEPYRRVSPHCFAALVTTLNAGFLLVILLRDTYDTRFFARADDGVKALHHELSSFLMRFVRYAFPDCARCNATDAFRKNDAKYCYRCGLTFKEHFKAIVYGEKV